MPPLQILVQAWGPMDGAGNAYKWITVGLLDNPPSTDLEALKRETLQIIGRQEFRPVANAARLVFKDGDKTVMKVTYLDLW